MSAPIGPDRKTPDVAAVVTSSLLSPRDVALVDAIATRMLELLDARRELPAGSRSRLVTAAELAAVLGVSRSTVYEQRVKLGARHVGDGPRPRLRFDVDQALAAWTACQSGEESQAPDPPATTGRTRHQRPTATGSHAPLLPVKGQKAA